MKKLLILVAIVPILGLFGGIGVLSWRISETWTDVTTQSLVTGLTVVCGGGALIVAVLLALIVGVPLAVRIFGEAGISHRAWSGGRTTLPSSWDDVPLTAHRLPSAIDTQWRALPQPPSMPPWGATGGGNPQLLPPPAQDERFRRED